MRTSLISFLAIMGCLLSGCVNLKPKPDLTQHFVLGPILPEAPDTSLARGNGVYVARPQLPAYWETNRLVYRGEDGSLLEISNARWAEPQPQGIARAVAEYLNAGGGGRAYGFYPWQKPDQELPEVRVSFQRIEAYADGRFVLSASWQTKDGERVIGQGTFTSVERTWTVGDSASYIEALNRSIEALATEISQQI
ncbi:MAG: PqiC family protein [Verrucomicrobiota bacterium]